MDPELMAAFGEMYGVEVTEDNYSSNEEMIARLQAGNSGYDLVFPSDYAVNILAEEGLLAELTFNNIPNLEHVEPALRGMYFDATNTYSVPFQWGTTGIAYNSAYMEAPTSWATLFDPEAVDVEVAFFTMLDDERESIGAALKYLGYSINESDPAAIEEAKELLLEQKANPMFSAYNSDDADGMLASEEIYFAHIWSGDAALAASEHEAIRYVIPEEGSVIWMDNMAIPADAPNRCTAELFINFILDPENAAQLTEYTYYNTPVTAARELLDPATAELLEGITPDAETMERLEWIERTEADTIYSDAWTEVKAR
jgi:spermidine/putrescine transport system substrate-binding protein